MRGEWWSLLTVGRQRIPTSAADLGPVSLQTTGNAQHVFGIPLQLSLAKPPDILTAGRTFLGASLAHHLG